MTADAALGKALAAIGRALSPLQVGPVTVPNRIFRPAHTTNMSPDGRIGDRFVAYHEARARGGAGLIVLDASPVHPTAALQPNLFTIWDDEAIDGLKWATGAIGAHGTKTFIQLWHGGFNALPRDGGPPWSASALPGAVIGQTALAMTEAMIAEIVEAFRLAARRAVAAGVDGIEVHAGHGYLFRQFLATATNRRTDRYGGSFDNRARLLVEVLTAIRGAVPASVAVGARIGPDTRPGLSDLKENVRLVCKLEALNLLDYVNLSVGEYTDIEVIIAGMQEPAGYQLDHFQGFRQATRLPLLVTGRFRTIEEADQVIRTGQAEMVGMVRAQLADPDLVRKTREGRVAEVRPCIACNQRCVAGLLTTGEVGCSVNPAAGQEFAIGDGSDGSFAPAARRKKVWVVGGGPAGMEAARVAALRGHDVTLHEAQPDCGGTTRMVAHHAPRMSSFGDITYWQEAELQRLGVTLLNNSYVDADDVRAAGPDAVIVAAGSTPTVDGWQRDRPAIAVRGVDKPHVVSSLEALLRPKERLGSTAVVLDDIGHYEAIAAAEHLVNAGVSVTYVSRMHNFAPLMEPAFRATPAFRRMRATGLFSFRPRSFITEITDTSVIAFEDGMENATFKIPADTVVLVGFNRPNNELVADLAGSGITVIPIGDANSPRYLETAIAEGQRAGATV